MVDARQPSAQGPFLRVSQYRPYPKFSLPSASAERVLLYAR
jgi:hypothetical protein